MYLSCTNAENKIAFCSCQVWMLNVLCKISFKHLEIRGEYWRLVCIFREGTMPRKWMEFKRRSPPLIHHLWWLFKGLRCFWRTIFILSHWKLNKGYYEEALWILLGRRFCRLICKPVVTKYIFGFSKAWRHDPKTFPADIFLQFTQMHSPFWTNTI